MFFAAVVFWNMLTHKYHYKQTPRHKKPHSDKPFISLPTQFVRTSKNWISVQ